MGNTEVYSLQAIFFGKPAEAGTPPHYASTECVVARPLRIVAEMRKHPGGSGMNMATSTALQPDRSRWCIAFRRFFYLAV
jgi:hypothetical protein